MSNAQTTRTLLSVAALDEQAAAAERAYCEDETGTRLNAYEAAQDDADIAYRRLAPQIVAMIRELAQKWEEEAEGCYKIHFTDCLCGPQRKRDADQLTALLTRPLPGVGE